LRLLALTCESVLTAAVCLYLQIHYLDPEDLLLRDERDGLAALPSLPGHFEANRRLAALLEQASISFA
jgi:hypothetical protein